MTTDRHRKFGVMTIDHYHVPDEDAARISHEFPTAELAAEFARRWTRDSLEEFRKPGLDKEAVRKGWQQFGENALVSGGGYNARDELEFFLDHPATAAERDWNAVLEDAKKVALPALPRLERGKDGRLELRLSDRGDEPILEELARELEVRFGAACVQRVSGLDQSDWDFRLGRGRVTLHREHYLGISLFGQDPAGEKAVRALARDLGLAP